MKSVFSSDLAVAVLAALGQRPDGLPLAELARAAGSALSAMQTAVRLLADVGLVTPIGSPRPRYLVADGAEVAAEHLVEAALALRQDHVADAAIRANPAVEFAARDADGLLVVTRFDANVADEARLEALIAAGGGRTRVIRHDEVADELDQEPDLRTRATCASRITGTLERSFREPGKHGSLSSPFLGNLHPDLPRPPATAIARLARSFDLERVRVFGSAVHDDFRPDSDVDVLVRRRRGVRRSIDVDLRLRRALEDLFDHDVDVVDEAVVRPHVAERAHREGVTLYG